jgi:predicted site-specific integrase-resolvase
MSPEAGAGRLGVGQAARTAGVSRQAVHAWIRGGRLPAARVAGRYAIAPADLAPVLGARKPRPAIERHALTVRRRAAA